MAALTGRQRQLHWQAPAPLHVLAPAHSLSGSAPATIFVHVPVPFEHVWQVPEQLVLQQRLSTQKPLMHWL